MKRLHGHARYGWALFICAVAAGGALMGAFVYAATSNGQQIQTNQEQIQQLRTALTALCAQRDDLDQRIVVSTAILQTHRGRLVFGIPRELIVTGLHRDRATRQNLAILDCKEAR